jgi:hypothetical protein
MNIRPRPRDRSKPGQPETSPESRVSVVPGRVQRLMYGILSYRTDFDGRIFVVGALVAYFLGVAIPRIFLGTDIWPRLGVPSGPSLFFDTRNVTAALDCRRLGFDPLVQNPCDPWGRPLNYPRVWLALRWLGLNQSHTDALAIAFIVLFFWSVLLLVGRISLGQGILVAVAVCSPSVMFAIERANMDIVVFSIMALAVIAWRRRTEAARIVSPLIVLAAATTKIYPVFALPPFLFMRSRRASIVAILCVMAFAVYALLTIGDIQAVARVAPQGDYHAFGARILPAAIYHRFVPDRWQGGAITKQLLAIVPLLIAAPVVWRVGRRRLPDQDPEAGSAVRLAFYVGALVFLGTFAVGNNFDYRLVFILLTLPQLFEWITDRSGDPRSSLASVSALAVLILLWIGALSEPLRLTDEVATWATVVLLGALLAASVPRIRVMWQTIRSL